MADTSVGDDEVALLLGDETGVSAAIVGRESADSRLGPSTPVPPTGNAGIAGSRDTGSDFGSPYYGGRFQVGTDGENSWELRHRTFGQSVGGPADGVASASSVPVVPTGRKQSVHEVFTPSAGTPRSAILEAAYGGEIGSWDNEYVYMDGDDAHYEDDDAPEGESPEDAAERAGRGPRPQGYGEARPETQLHTTAMLNFMHTYLLGEHGPLELGDGEDAWQLGDPIAGNEMVEYLSRDLDWHGEMLLERADDVGPVLLDRIDGARVIEDLRQLWGFAVSRLKRAERQAGAGAYAEVLFVPTGNPDAPVSSLYGLTDFDREFYVMMTTTYLDDRELGNGRPPASMPEPQKLESRLRVELFMDSFIRYRNAEVDNTDYWINPGMFAVEFANLFDDTDEDARGAQGEPDDPDLYDEALEFMFGTDEQPGGYWEDFRERMAARYTQREEARGGGGELLQLRPVDYVIMQFIMRHLMYPAKKAKDLLKLFANTMRGVVDASKRDQVTKEAIHSMFVGEGVGYDWTSTQAFLMKKRFVSASTLGTPGEAASTAAETAKFQKAVQDGTDDWKAMLVRMPLPWTPMGRVVRVHHQDPAEGAADRDDSFGVDYVMGAAEWAVHEEDDFPFKEERHRRGRNTGYDQARRSNDPFFVRNPSKREPRGTSGADLLWPGWIPRGRDPNNPIPNSTEIHEWSELRDKLFTCLAKLTAFCFDVESLEAVPDDGNDVVFDPMKLHASTPGRDNLSKLYVAKLLAECDDAVLQLFANMRCHLWSHSRASASDKPWHFCAPEDQKLFSRKLLWSEDELRQYSGRAYNSAKQDLYPAAAPNGIGPDGPHPSWAGASKVREEMNTRKRYEQFCKHSPNKSVEYEDWVAAKQSWRETVKRNHPGTTVLNGRVFNHFRVLPEQVLEDRQRRFIAKDDPNNPTPGERFEVDHRVIGTLDAIDKYGVSGNEQYHLRFRVFNIMDKIEKYSEMMRGSGALDCVRERAPKIPGTTLDDPGYVWAWRTGEHGGDMKLKNQVRYTGTSGQPAPQLLRDVPGSGGLRQAAPGYYGEREVWTCNHEFSLPDASAERNVAANRMLEFRKQGRERFNRKALKEKLTDQQDKNLKKFLDTTGVKKVPVWQDYGWPRDLDGVVSSENPGAVAGAVDNIFAAVQGYIKYVREFVKLFEDGDAKSSPMASLLITHQREGRDNKYMPALYEFVGAGDGDAVDRRPAPIVEQVQREVEALDEDDEDDELGQEVSAPLLKIIQGAPIGQELVGLMGQPGVQSEPVRQLWWDWFNDTLNPRRNSQAQLVLKPTSDNPQFVHALEDDRIDPDSAERADIEGRLRKWDGRSEKERHDLYTKLAFAHTSITFQLAMAEDEVRRSRLPVSDPNRLLAEHHYFSGESYPGRKEDASGFLPGIHLPGDRDIDLLNPATGRVEKYTSTAKVPMTIAKARQMVALLKVHTDKLFDLVAYERYLHKYLMHYSPRFKSLYDKYWVPLRLKREGNEIRALNAKDSKLANAQWNQIQRDGIDVTLPGFSVGSAADSSPLVVNLKYDDDHALKQCMKGLDSMSTDELEIEIEDRLRVYREELAKQDHKIRKQISGKCSAMAITARDSDCAYIKVVPVSDAHLQLFRAMENAANVFARTGEKAWKDVRDGGGDPSTSADVRNNLAKYKQVLHLMLMMETQRERDASPNHPGAVKYLGPGKTEGWRGDEPIADHLRSREREPPGSKEGEFDPATNRPYTDAELGPFKAAFREYEFARAEGVIAIWKALGARHGSLFGSKGAHRQATANRARWTAEVREVSEKEALNEGRMTKSQKLEKKRKKDKEAAEAEAARVAARTGAAAGTLGTSTSKPDDVNTAMAKARDAVRLVISRAELDENELIKFDDLFQRLKAAVVNERRNLFAPPGAEGRYRFTAPISEHIIRLAGRISRLLSAFDVVDPEAGRTDAPEQEEMKKTFKGVERGITHDGGDDKSDDPTLYVLRAARVYFIDEVRRINPRLVTPLPAGMVYKPTVVQKETDRTTETRRKNSLKAAVKREVERRRGGVIALDYRIDLRGVFIEDPKTYIKFTEKVKEFEIALDRSRRLRAANRFGVDFEKVENQREADSAALRMAYGYMIQRELNLVDFTFERLATRERMLTDFIGELKAVIQAGAASLESVRLLINSFIKRAEQQAMLHPKMIGRAFLQILKVIETDLQASLRSQRERMVELVECRMLFRDFVVWMRDARAALGMGEAYDAPRIVTLGGVLDEVQVGKLFGDLQILALQAGVTDDDNVIASIVKELPVNVPSPPQMGRKRGFSQMQSAEQRSVEGTRVTLAGLKACISDYRSVYLQPAIRGIDDEVFPGIAAHIREAIANPNTEALDDYFQLDVDQVGMTSPGVAFGGEYDRRRDTLVMIATEDDLKELVALVRTAKQERNTVNAERYGAMLEAATRSFYERRSDRARELAGQFDPERQGTSVAEVVGATEQLTLRKPEMPAYLALDLARRDTKATADFLGSNRLHREPASDGMGLFLDALNKKTVLTNWKNEFDSLEKRINQLQTDIDSGLGWAVDDVEEQGPAAVAAATKALQDAEQEKDDCVGRLGFMIQMVPFVDLGELPDPSRAYEMASSQLIDATARYDEKYAELKRYWKRTLVGWPGMDQQQQQQQPPPQQAKKQKGRAGPSFAPTQAGRQFAERDSDLPTLDINSVKSLLENPRWRKNADFFKLPGSVYVRDGTFVDTEYDTSFARTQDPGGPLYYRELNPGGNATDRDTFAKEEQGPEMTIYGFGGRDDDAGARRARGNDLPVGWDDWKRAVDFERLTLGEDPVLEPAAVIRPPRARETLFPEPETDGEAKSRTTLQSAKPKELKSRGAQDAWRALGRGAPSYQKYLKREANSGRFPSDLRWVPNPSETFLTAEDVGGEWEGLDPDYIQTESDGEVMHRQVAKAEGSKMAWFLPPELRDTQFSRTPLDGKIYWVPDTSGQVVTGVWRGLPDTYTSVDGVVRVGAALAAQRQQAAMLAAVRQEYSATGPPFAQENRSAMERRARANRTIAWSEQFQKWEGDVHNIPAPEFGGLPQPFHRLPIQRAFDRHVGYAQQFSKTPDELANEKMRFVVQFMNSVDVRIFNDVALSTEFAEQYGLPRRSRFDAIVAPRPNQPIVGRPVQLFTMLLDWLKVANDPMSSIRSEVQGMIDAVITYLRLTGQHTDVGIDRVENRYDQGGPFLALLKQYNEQVPDSNPMAKRSIEDVPLEWFGEEPGVLPSVYDPSKVLETEAI